MCAHPHTEITNVKVFLKQIKGTVKDVKGIIKALAPEHAISNTDNPKHVFRARVCELQSAELAT